MCTAKLSREFWLELRAALAIAELQQTRTTPKVLDLVSMLNTYRSPDRPTLGGASQGRTAVDLRRTNASRKRSFKAKNSTRLLFKVLPGGLNGFEQRQAILEKDVYFDAIIEGGPTGKFVEVVAFETTLQHVQIGDPLFC